MSSPNPMATKRPRRTKAADLTAVPPAEVKSPQDSSRINALQGAEPLSAVTRKPASREQLKEPAVDALELAKKIENDLAEGRLDTLTPQALQALMAAVCKTYAANIEAGRTFPLLSSRSSVTGTDVMVTCGALLKSADLQVFELGMWQSWTGR